MMLLGYLGKPSATVTYSITNADKTEHTAATGTGVTALKVGTLNTLYGVVVADPPIGGVVHWYEGGAYITSEIIAQPDAAIAGDPMTLTAAYDNAKDDVLTPLAAAKAVVDAIPTTPLLADDYTAPDNATVAAIAADYAKTGEAAAAVVGLATEANATANKNAVIAAMPDIPPPDVGTTITPATLDTGGTALGRVMPYGVVTAYVGTTAYYQFTADADGDYSYVLPDGSTWTLKARRAGYQTMTAEVTT